MKLSVAIPDQRFPDLIPGDYIPSEIVNWQTSEPAAMLPGDEFTFGGAQHFLNLREPSWSPERIYPDGISSGIVLKDRIEVIQIGVKYPLNRDRFKNDVSLESPKNLNEFVLPQPADPKSQKFVDRVFSIFVNRFLDPPEFFA